MGNELKEKVEALSKFLKENNMTVEILNDKSMEIKVDGVGFYVVESDKIKDVQYEPLCAFHN